jgi:Lar family restriction alleviation protein
VEQQQPENDPSVAVAECPFCGADGFDFIAPFADLDYLCIQCRFCSSRGPLAPSGREAMRLWNGRVTAAGLAGVGVDSVKRSR